MTTKRFIGACAAAFVVSLNLGAARLWDEDEPKNATCAAEMLARGDWIVPTFNGEPRYHKPILVYWLMGLSTAIGGDSPFGARLVSAVAGSLSCVLVYALGKRMLGSPRASWRRPTRP